MAAFTKPIKRTHEPSKKVITNLSKMSSWTCFRILPREVRKDRTLLLKWMEPSLLQGCCARACASPRRNGAPHDLLVALPVHRSRRRRASRQKVNITPLPG